MNYEFKERNQIKSITNYLEDALEKMPNLNYVMDTIFQEKELIEVLDLDLPDSTFGKSEFIKDITNISQHFFKTTKSKKIQIRIDVIETDMCRLFHVDNNTQRLLCTYHGTGTQWLEDDNVNREALGKGDNTKIVKSESKIKQTTIFDILVLKGQKFSTSLDGVVHRSPPIEYKNEKRILLKIDECE